VSPEPKSIGRLLHQGFMIAPATRCGKSPVLRYFHALKWVILLQNQCSRTR